MTWLYIAVLVSGCQKATDLITNLSTNFNRVHLLWVKSVFLSYIHYKLDILHSTDHVVSAVVQSSDVEMMTHESKPLSQINHQSGSTSKLQVSLLGTPSDELNYNEIAFSLLCVLIHQIIWELIISVMCVCAIHKHLQNLTYHTAWWLRMSD